MTAVEAMIYCLGDAEWGHDNEGNILSRRVLDANKDLHWFYWDVEFDGEDALPELQSECGEAFAKHLEPYSPAEEEPS